MATAKKVVKKVAPKKVVTKSATKSVTKAVVEEPKQFKCDNCEDSGLQCSVCNQNPDFAQ